MNDTSKETPQDAEILYGDPAIRSDDAPIPTFLKWTYILLPIWGIITFFLFWNGSSGWTDRGYWQQLQRAANTTIPEINYQEVEQEKDK